MKCSINKNIVQQGAFIGKPLYEKSNIIGWHRKSRKSQSKKEV